MRRPIKLAGAMTDKNKKHMSDKPIFEIEFKHPKEDVIGELLIECWKGNRKTKVQREQFSQFEEEE